MVRNASVTAIGDNCVTGDNRPLFDSRSGAAVFVEVKTRTGDGFGGLAQAVTAQKARRLRRLAGIWLAAQDQRWAAVRIDVIGVRIGRRRTPELMHLQGVG